MNIHVFLYILPILFIVIGYNSISGVLSADGDIGKMSKYMLGKG
jgi:hypothetical protein